jgi:hypothetical protein
MLLRWAELYDDITVAPGTDYHYLITAGESTATVKLTRWSARPGAAALSQVAAEAARCTFEVHAEESEVTADATARRLAQAFEDGQDLWGRPAWQHEKRT